MPPLLFLISHLFLKAERQYGRHVRPNMSYKVVGRACAARKIPIEVAV
jgi:hypothetical protein